MLKKKGYSGIKSINSPTSFCIVHFKVLTLVFWLKLYLELDALDWSCSSKFANVNKLHLETVQVHGYVG